MLPRSTRFRPNPRVPRDMRFSVELIHPAGVKPRFYAKERVAVEEAVILAYDRKGVAVVSDEQQGELVAQVDAKSKRLVRFRS